MTELNTITIGGSTVPARVASSRLQQARGHMFRRERPEWALVFSGNGVSHYGLHMLFVPFTLQALFVVDGVVEDVAELAPWTGTASAEAETVVEVPPRLVDADAGTEVMLDA